MRQGPTTNRAHRAALERIGRDGLSRVAELARTMDVDAIPAPAPSFPGKVPRMQMSPLKADLPFDHDIAFGLMSRFLDELTCRG